MNYDSRGFDYSEPRDIIALRPKVFDVLRLTGGFGQMIWITPLGISDI